MYVTTSLKLKAYPSLNSFSFPNAVGFTLPETQLERLNNLRDMVLVMIVDGEIDSNEMILCKTMAMKMGFRIEVIDVILEELIKSVNENIQSELLLNLLKNSDSNSNE